MKKKEAIKISRRGGGSVGLAYGLIVFEVHAVQPGNYVNIGREIPYTRVLETTLLLFDLYYNNSHSKNKGYGVWAMKMWV